MYIRSEIYYERRHIIIHEAIISIKQNAKFINDDGGMEIYLDYRECLFDITLLEACID